MKIALLAATLFLPLAQAASLTGAVVDLTGASIRQAAVEVDSGARKWQAQTDDMGVYKFTNLPAGEYTLVVNMAGFKRFSLKSIVVLEGQERRLPDVPLDLGNGCGSPFRDLVLLPDGGSFGRLSGIVTPQVKDVEVTLVCRTFAPCRSTKTDSNGQFSFDMISAGSYGLNFRRQGFYTENATGYSYDVNAGWESIYNPVRLERCLRGNCDPQLRPKPAVFHCE
jgi:hypothetical protein